MEGEDGEEWRKLPCEDRIAHKVGVPLLDILTLLRKEEEFNQLLFRCGRLG